MKPRILVWLSGWVDSAVTAYLLQQQGYDVTAGFMINYTTDDEHCTTKADLAEAQKVADHLGIKLYTFDFQDAYHERIVRYIVDSYAAGLTPNPDVMCNSLVKFDLFLEEALALGFDKVATGHYARIIPETLPSKEDIGGGNYTWETTTIYRLLTWVDSNKDQSYFLARLSQLQLQHAMFPLGELTKPEVRQIAQEAQLPNADRKDSQGICFIGKIPMSQFLDQYIPKKTWPIVDSEGRKIGEHEGVRGYTIGQRKGIKVAHSEPLFVLSKDITTNTLTVGPASSDELFTQQMHIHDRQWSAQPYSLPFDGTGMIRYRQTPVRCSLSRVDDTEIYTVTFDDAQRAVASGQIFVMYDGEKVVGSGVIG